MKRIVYNILFLLTIVWAWNTIGEYVAYQEEETAFSDVLGAENPQAENSIVSVLTHANSYADVSVRTVQTFSPNVSRRYRPGEFSFERVFASFEQEQALSAGNVLKISHGLSQECAARLKYAGYYIYMLRKIII